MPTPQDALPARLRTAFIAISEFPSTNGIKVVALALIIATGAVLAVASSQLADVSEATLGLWLSALLAMLGIGSWQQKMKRDTPHPTPPAAPDIEDVAATTGTPAPATPVLSKADAQLAAKVLDAAPKQPSD